MASFSTAFYYQPPRPCQSGFAELHPPIHQQNSAEKMESILWCFGCPHIKPAINFMVHLYPGSFNYHKNVLCSGWPKNLWPKMCHHPTKHGCEIPFEEEQS